MWEFLKNLILWTIFNHKIRTYVNCNSQIRATALHFSFAHGCYVFEFYFKVELKVFPWYFFYISVLILIFVEYTECFILYFSWVLNSIFASSTILYYFTIDRVWRKNCNFIVIGNNFMLQFCWLNFWGAWLDVKNSILWKKMKFRFFFVKNLC